MNNWEKEFDKLDINLIINRDKTGNSMNLLEEYWKILKPIIKEELKNEFKPFIQNLLDKQEELSDKDYKAIISTPAWEKWEKYQYSLFSKHFKNKSKHYTGCWDTNETRECGEISRGHLMAFTKWLINKLDKQKEEIREKIEKDLNNGRFNLICSNEITFKDYILKELNKEL